MLYLHSLWRFFDSIFESSRSDTTTMHYALWTVHSLRQRRYKLAFSLYPPANGWGLRRRTGCKYRSTATAYSTPRHTPIHRKSRIRKAFHHRGRLYDRGAWQATVRRVAQSQTWLKWLSTYAHTCLPPLPSQPQATQICLRQYRLVLP